MWKLKKRGWVSTATRPQLFLAGPSQPDTQKELGGTTDEFKEMKVNLIQQMYFIFATSDKHIKINMHIKINNFFSLYLWKTKYIHTHTQTQNQETNNKHNNADEVNQKRASAVLLSHHLSFQTPP